MADVPKVGEGPGAGPHNINLRLSMREALLVHQALRDKEAELRKEAWWLGERGAFEGVADIKQQAQEHAEAADRIFKVLDGIIGTER